MVIDPVQLPGSITKVALGTRQEQAKPQPDAVTTIIAATTGRDGAVEIAPLSRETAQQLILKELLGSLDGIIQAEGLPPLADIDPMEFSMEKVVERILAQAESFLLKAENKADLDYLLGEVRKGIEQGFERANITLGDLKALDNEEIVSDIEETRTLISEGLARLNDNIITRLLEQSETEIVADLTDPAANSTDSATGSAADPDATPDTDPEQTLA